MPAYLALTHKAVEEILAGDNKTFARDPKHWPALYDGSIPEDWPFRAIVQGDHLSTKDGADHRRLRGLVGKGFTPARVRALEPRIQQLIDALLDEVERAGDGVDLVPAFCDALPMAVISELFGVPESERAQLRRWTLASLRRTPRPRRRSTLRSRCVGICTSWCGARRTSPGTTSPPISSAPATTGSGSPPTNWSRCCG
ncbi:protein of unknown function [Nocardia cyriacigeorgica GUH-2]|uniref:Cytochrome P450 n=1 Tax=Nocardia cyriacigeorgica (strain GUH-2) TaxID=1127134 RepID=H6RCL2_NOCCG|nr:protein of unknown function [Nocardia cyriacigeorgica GUH-2]